MTTDTVIAEVLEEAESIVCAEWLRLLAAAISEHPAAGRPETPVARPGPPMLAFRCARPGRRGVPLPACCRHRSATRRRDRRVWPTQRSPP